MEVVLGRGFVGMCWHLSDISSLSYNFCLPANLLISPHSFCIVLPLPWFPRFASSNQIQVMEATNGVLWKARPQGER